MESPPSGRHPHGDPDDTVRDMNDGNAGTLAGPPLTRFGGLPPYLDQGMGRAANWRGRSRLPRDGGSAG